MKITGEDLDCSHFKTNFGNLKYITCDIIYEASKFFPGKYIKKTQIASDMSRIEKKIIHYPQDSYEDMIYST